jgi:hypothetical protein
MKAPRKKTNPTTATYAKKIAKSNMMTNKQAKTMMQKPMPMTIVPKRYKKSEY